MSTRDHGQSLRTVGLRAETGIVIPYSHTTKLPLYQRYFLGGETQRQRGLKMAPKTPPPPALHPPV